MTFGMIRCNGGVLAVLRGLAARSVPRPARRRSHCNQRAEHREQQREGQIKWARADERAGVEFVGQGRLHAA